MRCGRLEIIVCLLEACQEMTHKTALVYKTNLNLVLSSCRLLGTPVKSRLLLFSIRIGGLIIYIESEHTIPHSRGR